MKHFLKYFFCILVAALVSCGEAGVQIKVGDDFDTGLDVLALGVVGTASGNESTSINDELLDYGDFINEVEVQSLSLSFDNVESSFLAEIELNIQGQIVNTGEIEISNTNSEELTNINLTALEPILRTGDVNIGFTITTDDPLADNDFDMIVTMNVFATIQAD